MVAQEIDGCGKNDIWNLEGNRSLDEGLSLLVSGVASSNYAVLLSPPFFPYRTKGSPYSEP